MWMRGEGDSSSWRHECPVCNSIVLSRLGQCANLELNCFRQRRSMLRQPRRPLRGPWRPFAFACTDCGVDGWDDDAGWIGDERDDDGDADGDVRRQSCKRQRQRSEPQLQRRLSVIWASDWPCRIETTDRRTCRCCCWT